MILDIGSGGNSEFPATFKRPGAICIDKRPSEGALVADVEDRLPFDDSSVSKVFMYDVIEHLDSPGKALKEILRVLEPGGELELGTPNALWAPKVVRFESGSAEMQANAEGEPMFIRGLWTAIINAKAHAIPKQEAINGLAFLIGLSPATTRKYLDKQTSEQGPFTETGKGALKMVTLKPEWMAKLRQEMGTAD